MNEEGREETLVVLPECFVYKIPPRTSASGYRAENWNLSNFLWSGRVLVTAKGENCTIRLEDVDTGNVFAMCPVNLEGPRAVEPVLDSSRYFVLRIEDGKGHHAFIGMGFTERGDAFDFNVALQEHVKRVKRDKELAEAQERLASEPPMDFSLKSGQTIKVNLKVMMQRKVQAAREAKKLREQIRKKKEEREVRKLRKQMVHKARPIFQPTALPKMPTPKPLTEPSTPNFASFKTRLGRGRLLHNNNNTHHGKTVGTRRRALGDRTNQQLRGW